MRYNRSKIGANSHRRLTIGWMVATGTVFSLAAGSTARAEASFVTRLVVSDLPLHVRIRPATEGKKPTTTTHSTGTESTRGKAAKHARVIAEMVAEGRIVMSDGKTRAVREC